MREVGDELWVVVSVYNVLAGTLSHLDLAPVCDFVIVFCSFVTSRWSYWHFGLLLACNQFASVALVQRQS